MIDSGFGSEALLLTGHWILASFALELSALWWLIQSSAVLAGCHIYTFLTDAFLATQAHEKGDIILRFKSPDPEDTPRACASRFLS